MEKYIGDTIHKDEKQDATTVDRVAIGYLIAANILAFLLDISLGHRKIEKGLELRQAWLINEISYNCEIWLKFTNKGQNRPCYNLQIPFKDNSRSTCKSTNRTDSF